MDIQTSRTLGIISACFTLLGAVSGFLSLTRFAYPNVAPSAVAFLAVSGVVGVFGLLGFVLFLVAMYGFSKSYSESRIFSYILWGLIITFVAMFGTVIIYLAFVFSNITNIIPPINGTPLSQTQIQTLIQTSMAPFVAISGFLVLPNIVLTVKAFYLLADKSQVSLFKDAAKVLLAGAVLTIMLGTVFAVLAYMSSVSINSLFIIAVPGGIVQDVAWAFLVVAFFRIKPAQPQTPATTNFAYASQTKYCTKCGTPNQPETIYCKHCGQKF